MTSQQIVSQVANSVNDPAFVKINKEEYLQMMNDTVKEIGLQARIFEVTQDYDLIEGESTHVLTDVDIIDIIRLDYYFSGVTTPLPMNEKSLTKVQNELYYPNGFSYEYLSSTVEYTDSDGVVFLTIVNSGLDVIDDISTKVNWYGAIRDNGMITLYFPFKFASGDKIRIHYHSTEADQSTFDDVEIFYTPYADVLKEGMRFRALQSMLLREKGDVNTMWMLQKECIQAERRYYNQRLPFLKRFIASLVSSSDSPEMRPFHFP